MKENKTWIETSEFDGSCNHLLAANEKETWIETDKGPPAPSHKIPFDPNENECELDGSCSEEVDTSVESTDSWSGGCNAIKIQNV
jgi:hypothetical protein